MEPLQILALDTSSRGASVALLDGENLIGQATLTPQEQTARELAPTVSKLLGEAGRKPGDLNLIAVSQGPGSFTGLRIGVTFAKTLAYATGADVIGVDTLEVIATQALPGGAGSDAAGKVEAVLDAYRGQLFAARFQRSAGGGLTRVADTRTIDVEPWLQSLTAGLLIAGPVLEKLQDRLPDNVSLAARDCWTPQAETVGRLALAQHQAGQRHDHWSLTPRYYRASAAEEKAK